MIRQLNIMGTRGVPGAHGGYETFASRFAPYMVERGWRVIVYCQDDDGTLDGTEDDWEGVRRVFFSPRSAGALGTMQFDARCVRDVLRRPGIDLVLGYNTASFNLVQRLRGRRVAMNMDGIEWKRDKWSPMGKAWFFLNELAGSGFSNLLIADHPEIERHLRPRAFGRPIVMIPYGADAIDHADTEPVTELGLEPGRYMVKIARAAPENSILEVIRAFSRRPRGYQLAVLGKFEAGNGYHEACREAAGPEIIFPGTVFEQRRVQALRFHARAYIHGHKVGGTNPSLCEALGAGNAVIANDNRFNRWTAGSEQLFFDNEDACDQAIQRLIDDDACRAALSAAARRRHAEAFTWPGILASYEEAMTELLLH